MVDKKKTVYADKFFGTMKPGVMGTGLIGLNQEGRKGKVKPLFATMDELTEM